MFNNNPKHFIRLIWCDLILCVVLLRAASVYWSLQHSISVASEVFVVWLIVLLYANLSNEKIKEREEVFFFVYFPWLWYTERRRRNEKRLYIVCSAHTQSRIKRNKKNNIGATRLSLRWQQIHTTSARLHTHTTLTKTPKCLHTAHTGNVSSSQNIEERSKQKIYHREIGLYVRCVL